MVSKMGALDKSVVIGNTILLEKSEENNKNRLVCVGALKYILS